MVNAGKLPALFLNVPTAVQFSSVGHDTELNCESGFSDWTPSSNCAGCASSHSPSIDVMVNASLLPSLFLNLPTAVQFPSVGHDTELNCESGFSDWTPSSNCAGCAKPHTPSIDVMVNASLLSSMFLNLPTAVQFPGDEHDTSLKAVPALISSPTSTLMPSSNCAGCASSHSPSVDVMVNASMLSSMFLNLPTAVQFPSVGHDTEKNNAPGFTFWMPFSNCAGCASSHSPSSDVMVNAS